MQKMDDDKLFLWVSALVFLAVTWFAIQAALHTDGHPKPDVPMKYLQQDGGSIAPDIDVLAPTVHR